MSTGEPFFQIVRFALAGAALTLLVSLLYLLATGFTSVGPAVALTLATALASVAGYFVHNSFSFRGSGKRDWPTLRFGRFLVTNGVGYVLNLSFVYIMEDFAHLSEWTPVLAFCTVTPLATFLLNRNWVFA